MHADGPVQLRFDPSEDSAIHWAARSGIEHALALRKLEELYARALPYLRAWAYALTTKHGWSDEPVELIGEMPVAVCLGRNVQLPTNEESPSTPHVSRLVLPRQFAAFLDPSLVEDWAAMFHNLMTPYTTPHATDIFQLGRAAGIPRPLQNILYLLQVLSPGLLLVRFINDEIDEWDVQATDHGLPPSLWVGLHIEDLEDIFGAPAALALYHAAEDPYCSSEVSSTAGSDNDSFDSSSLASFNSDEDCSSSSNWGDDDFDYQDQLLAEFDRANIELAGHGKTGVPSEPMLAKFTFDNDPAEDTMDYRHCDAECSYCGRCDERFAQQLMQRLLSMAVAA
jgi:hypothetical protein